MPTGQDSILPVPLSEYSAGSMGYSSRQEPPSDEEGGGINVQRYVAAILRYKWMILGLVLVGLAAGAGLSRVIKPTFEAQAAIQIDGASRNQQQVSPIRTSQLLESRAWIDLMRTYRVLDEVVLRRRLFVEPSTPSDAPLFADFGLKDDFVAGAYALTADASGERMQLLDPAGSAVQAAAPGDSIGSALGFVWIAPRLQAGQTVAFRISPPREAAVKLNQALITTLPIENPSFLRMSLRGSDPREVAETVNAIAERFVEVATTLKREKLTTVANILEAQVASAYVDLRTAETQLENFRVGTITLPSDRGATQIASGLAETRDPVRDAYFQLRIDRDALALDRDAIARALAAGNDSSGALVISLGAITSVRQTPELSLTLTQLGAKRAEARGLRVAFTSAHRPLQELEAEITQLERRTVPEQARQLIANLDERTREFDQRIASSGREMQQIPTRAIEETRRESNVTSARTLHTELRSSYEQAKLAELSAAPDVRILDRAVPPSRPVTDQLLLLFAGGLFGGLGFGVALAILLDRMDRRFRYPEQVTNELGLMILGSLPLVVSGKNGRGNPDDEGQLTEALRSVRMSLAYAHGTAGTFITTVTSPGPGDGKSFLASNLARSFASSGRRTLLIDGDTRRGHLHRTLGTERRPGLLDYLDGTATREEIVRVLPKDGFDFIACGTRSAGGPEMLASQKMSQLVMMLRTEYAAIIIDSPPLGAGIDPLVLASLTGSLVMVLRTGVTDKELAEARLQDLNRLPVRVLGAVLNEVKAEGIYRYYSYLPGYRAEDEAGVEPVKPSRRSLLRRG